MTPAHGRIAAAGLLFAVGCQSASKPAPAPPGRAVIWPAFGPPRVGPTLRGHTDGLPDFVGPIDGSARLTVFTEGNHFPVLLPLVFDRFPEWCAANSDCRIGPEEILVVTLPQVMLVEALTEGSITLGNAVLPVTPGRVYPQVVLGGTGPLGRLAGRGVVAPEARPFARHRGLGLLVSRERAAGVRSLGDLASSDARVVLATPNEAGARRQYLETLDALVGPRATERLLSREVATFPGRLGIQHRDVPYALLNGDADAGLIFRHLAEFYAGAYPEQLVFVPVDATAPFGTTIAVARATAASENPLADCFEQFLLEVAPAAYPAGGFASPETFRFGERVALNDADGE